MIIPSGRGMGAANCPSYQQVAGIDDVNDPCQIAAGMTASGNTIVPPAILTPTPAIIQAIAAGQTTLPPSPLPGTPTPMTGIMAWLQQNPMVLYVGGASLLAMLFLSVGGRRR